MIAFYILMNIYLRSDHAQKNKVADLIFHKRTTRTVPAVVG